MSNAVAVKRRFPGESTRKYPITPPGAGAGSDARAPGMRMVVGLILKSGIIFFH